MKIKHFLILAAAFWGFSVIIHLVFMPLNVMLADESDELTPISFLPVIFRNEGSGGQVTPTATAKITETPTSTATSNLCMSDGDNLVRNGGFENEAADWVLHNDGRQQYTQAKRNTNGYEDSPTRIDIDANTQTWANSYTDQYARLRWGRGQRAFGL